MDSTGNTLAVRTAYPEILQFYAKHMRLLDEGAAEEWADDFTGDAVFTQNVKPVPWRGRGEIAALMRRGADRLAASGIVRRHWLSMVSIDREDDDTVHTRYYAVIFETPKGGKPSVHLCTTGEDELVRHGDRWLVRYRSIAHDGVA